MGTVIPFQDPFAGDSNHTLPLRSPAEDCADMPPEPPAVIRGLVVLGSITEVSAYIRVGKTVFILMLAKASICGHTFLGCPTDRALWVYITEEGRASFADALRKAQMEEIDSQDMLILHRREVRKTPWPDLIRDVTAHARHLALGRPIVLVIDTLSRCAGLGPDQENNAGAAAQVMDPLTQAVGPDVAVVSGRHDRKGGGEVGESARGSSAFSGDMDILLHLRRPLRDGEEEIISNTRLLSAASRFQSTPAQDEPLRIRLQDHQYAILGDTALEQRYHNLDEQILLYVATHQGCTRRQVRDTAAIRAKTSTLAERIQDLLLGDKLREHPTDRSDARGRIHTMTGLYLGPNA